MPGKTKSGGSGSKGEDGRKIHFTDWDATNQVRRSWDEELQTGQRSDDHIVDQRTGEKQDIPSPSPQKSDQ